GASKPLTEPQQQALLKTRIQEAKAMAEKYGMQENPAFLKMVAMLVVDNIRGANERFGAKVDREVEPLPQPKQFSPNEKAAASFSHKVFDELLAAKKKELHLEPQDSLSPA